MIASSFGLFSAPGLVRRRKYTRGRRPPLQQQAKKLTSLNDKIAEFIADRLPNDEAAVELLCLDHNGTYVLPFPCRRVGDSWRNFATGEQIEAEVAGWRRRER